jgi:hypothetical protein
MYKNVILPAVLYKCETFPCVKGRTHTVGVTEWGAEENIWT